MKMKIQKKSQIIKSNIIISIIINIIKEIISKINIINMIMKMKMMRNLMKIKETQIKQEETQVLFLQLP